MKPKVATTGYLFLKYLSAIAPGGAGTDADREQLKRFFRLTVPGEKMAKIDAAAEMLLAWGGGTSLDAGPVIRDILEVLGFNRSEEHTSELQSLMRISYAVFSLKKKKSIIRRRIQHITPTITTNIHIVLLTKPHINTSQQSHSICNTNNTNQK